MPLRRLCLACAFAFFLIALPARAAPIFRLDLHHYPTDFVPGAGGEYQVEIANLGDSASSGPLSFGLALPNGLRRAAVLQSGTPAWSCPGAPGDLVIICTTNASIARHSVIRNLILGVDVAPTASGERSALARLEGGGAAEPATAREPTPLRAEPAPFGVLPASFLADSYAADGANTVREAGAHPAQVIVGLDLATLASQSQILAAGSIRHFQLAMPPGFIGNPTAPGQCTPAQLTIGACPSSAQVGRIELATGPFAAGGLPKTYSEPVFNIRSPHGVLADFAFVIAGNPVHVKFSLDPANDYAILASANDVNETEQLLDLRITLWGVPAEHSHDSERCGLPDTSSECATDLEPRPFLTVPADCGTDQAITLRGVDSWQQPGLFAPPLAYALPGRATDCERPRFEPDLKVVGTTPQADSPTGLQLRLGLPQNESPDGLATPPLRDLHLTLPPGVRISPSAAEGLAGCAPAEIGLGTEDPVSCPDASRIGEARIATPLLPEPLQGTLYLASPHDNPSGALFALYLVVQDTEERGLLLKLPGRLDLDPQTGRITAAFEDLPQLPFEELQLSFRSGPRAPLLSAPACGPQIVHASISSWAQPEAPLALEDTYDVKEGPSGAPCQAPSLRPFAPALSAGTVAPIAGTSTPFVLRLSRGDSEQQLSTASLTLPPGLSAHIAAIAPCPETATAAIPTGEGTARAQLLRPSCPTSSRLGTVTIAAGAGSEPLYLPGSAYLAGPYRGAPYSLLIVVPVLAGPFDLGTLTSRLAVAVDPSSAQLSLESEPLPSILGGVPIDLREIRLDLDRPGLIRNPTDCTETDIHGVATSTIGARAKISDRFQVGDCAALGFRPGFALNLIGGLARNGHPALRASLRGADGEAAIATTTFTLPPGELLDLHHLRALCPHNVAPGSCPVGSRLGSVRLSSPLASDPLVGPIYLREPAERLPDLTADLRGGGVHLVLHGRLTDSDGRAGIKLSALPDIPLSKALIKLPGGQRGIIVNSESLCLRHRHAEAGLSAHNGGRYRLRPTLRLHGHC